MNFSELDSDWSGLPDNYEVEIKEGQRMSDVSFNETNNNGTLNFQGKENLSTMSFQKLFRPSFLPSFSLLI